MKIKKLKNFGAMVAVSAATAFVCLFAYGRFFSGHQDVYVTDAPAQAHYASYDNAASSMGVPDNFTNAANVVIPFTVHINTKVPPKQVSGGQSGGPFGGMFGGDPFGGGRYYTPGKLASGSGVIISNDGYIVTNNHVVDDAAKIIVTLNNDKSYTAKVVGTDPNTDLAVLKIDAKNLPYAVFGNSDKVQIGQWVLACGYPLNLQTTVTAGIISAKSRNLGINDEGNNPIESYLQTDAAVNPGNSGGPLVNTEGKLVGINSAIATPTGSFAGYAYAIPSNLVRKVVNDILKYGMVQRAFLGVYLPNRQRGAMNISFDPHSDAVAGFHVIGVVDNGAAAQAGIQKGDIITELGSVKINSEADLLGTIADHRPGDKVSVTYLRDGTSHTADLVLKNKDGTTDIVKATIIDALGVDLNPLPANVAKQIGIPGGVMVSRIGSGLIKEQTDMEPHFIIVKAGNYPVKSVDDLKEALQKQGNNVMLSGFYPDRQGMYYYALNDVKSGIVN